MRSYSSMDGGWEVERDIERGGHNVVSDYENKVYRVGSVRVNKVTIDSTLLLASLRINR